MMMIMIIMAIVVMIMIIMLIKMMLMMMMQVYLALLISPAWRSPARTISGQHGSGQIPAGCCFRSFELFLFSKDAIAIL